MDDFENIGPLREYGEVVEKTEVADFFLGISVLTGVGLGLLVLLLSIAGFNLPTWPYLIIIPSSLLVGIGATILAVKNNSESVFVPVFQVNQDSGVTILRTPDPVDGENYEYVLVIPSESEGYVYRYQGRGPFHRDVQLIAIREQEKSQIEFDSRSLVELSTPVSLTV